MGWALKASSPNLKITTSHTYNSSNPYEKGGKETEGKGEKKKKKQREYTKTNPKTPCTHKPPPTQ